MAALYNVSKSFTKIIAKGSTPAQLDTARAALDTEVQLYLTNSGDGVASGAPTSSTFDVQVMPDGSYMLTQNIVIGTPGAVVTGGTTGNLVSIDANDLPADSGVAASDVQVKIASGVTGNLVSIDASDDIADSGIAASAVELQAVMDGLYMAAFSGADTSGGDANAAVTAKSAATPAAGDVVIAIFGYVTATNVRCAMPVVGTGFAAALVDDTGVKITQKQAAGNLSANDYVALIRPAR